MSLLLIEPDPETRRSMANELASLGEGPVDAVADLEAGTASLESTSHRLALVDVDAGRPGEGVGFVELLRNRSQAAVVVFGRAIDEVTIRRAGAARADGYLVKPLAPGALAACARTLLLVGGVREPARLAAVPVLTPHQLERVFAFVEDSLCGPVTLEAMAAAVEMSRGHFTRLFKATTGSTPYGYVTERRMVRAEQMLLKSSLSVGDVAAEVGFENQGHFSTLFKRRTGETPSRFRRRAAASAVGGAQ